MFLCHHCFLTSSSSHFYSLLSSILRLFSITAPLSASPPLQDRLFPSTPRLLSTEVSLFYSILRLLSSDTSLVAPILRLFPIETALFASIIRLLHITDLYLPLFFVSSPLQFLYSPLFSVSSPVTPLYSPRQFLSSPSQPLYSPLLSVCSPLKRRRDRQTAEGRDRDQGGSRSSVVKGTKRIRVCEELMLVRLSPPSPGQAQGTRPPFQFTAL